MTRLTFRGGQNIALKTPSRKFGESMRFYRDVLGLPFSQDYSCEFGPSRLWLDEVNRPRAEVWLELITNDLEHARLTLKQSGYEALDEEPLPDGFAGFWIKSPAGIVHLVSTANDE